MTTDPGRMTPRRRDPDDPYGESGRNLRKQVLGYLFFALFVAGVWWLVTAL